MDEEDVRYIHIDTKCVCTHKTECHTAITKNEIMSLEQHGRT